MMELRLQGQGHKGTSRVTDMDRQQGGKRMSDWNTCYKKIKVLENAGAHYTPWWQLTLGFLGLTGHPSRWPQSPPPSGAGLPSCPLGPCHPNALLASWIPFSQAGCPTHRVCMCGRGRVCSNPTSSKHIAQGCLRWLSVAGTSPWRWSCTVLGEG